MTTFSRRSVRTGIVTATSAVLLATALPATASASADIVDDMLAKLPSGQITCEQAGKYWTSEAEYNEMAAQAKVATLLHPRRAEISKALTRVEEAAERCNLRGGGQAPVETPDEDNPTQPEPAGPNPDTPDTPDSNDNDGNDQVDQDNQSPAPTPDNDNPGTTTPGNDNTENTQDDYEVPTLGSSNILVLLGLFAGSGSSR